jgi:hypothetical protein
VCEELDGRLARQGVGSDRIGFDGTSLLSGVPSAIHLCRISRSSAGICPVAGIGFSSSTIRIAASSATVFDGSVAAGTRQPSTSNKLIGAPNIGIAS